MMEGDIFRIVTMRCSDYCPDYLFVLAAAALKNCSRLEWIGMMQCNKLKRYFLIDPSCCTFSTSNFWWYLAWPGLAWYWYLPVLVQYQTSTSTRYRYILTCTDTSQYQYVVPVRGTVVVTKYRYQKSTYISYHSRYTQYSTSLFRLPGLANFSA